MNSAHDQTVSEKIIPRNIHFRISRHARRDWYGDDLVNSAMIDAFSIFLPVGERFFIRSLRHFAKRLQGTELYAEISGYSVQEAYHTREHEEYNKALRELGHDIQGMEAEVDLLLGAVIHPMNRLALTCAIEHITATFSIATLSHGGDIIPESGGRHRQLWMWHALEELEHAAVALDVFGAATKEKNMSRVEQYFWRIGGLISLTQRLLPLHYRVTRELVRHNGGPTGFRFVCKFIWATCGAPGFMRRGFLPFLGYFSPFFDPNSTRNDRLVDFGRQWLADELERDQSLLQKPARQIKT
jgi:predicted metal-dependent hydrolase